MCYHILGEVLTFKIIKAEILLSKHIIEGQLLESCELTKTTTTTSKTLII